MATRSFVTVLSMCELGWDELARNPPWERQLEQRAGQTRTRELRPYEPECDERPSGGPARVALASGADAGGWLKSSISSIERCGPSKECVKRIH